MRPRLYPCARTNRAAYALARRHARQILARDDRAWLQLAQCWALTFRPGDHTDTFYDKHLRILGMSIAFVLSYDATRRQISIRGYRARLRTDGRVTYGVSGDCEFNLDGAIPLVRYASPPAINAWKNSSLADHLLRMDAACWCRRNSLDRLPTIPRLPRVWLGFAAGQPPVYEVTSALKRLAARRAGISVERLNTNHPVLVKRLLRDTWESLLIQPGTAGNPTDLLLVDGEYCTQGVRALRAFEDFHQLLGADTWNPAREVKIHHVDNPAAGILAGHGIDPKRGFDQPIPHDVILGLESELRRHLGDLAVRFSQEDVFDGLTEPMQPLVASSEALPRLRTHLQPYWSACSTDTDLRRAIRRPNEPLHASGACRLQVLRTRNLAKPMDYAPGDLGRRIEIDWCLQAVDRPVETTAVSVLQTA